MQVKIIVTIMVSVLIIFGFSHEGSAYVISDNPNLSSITFWEATSGLHAFTFTIDSNQLTTRRDDPLSISNYDFMGVQNREYYDVFYSNAGGSYSIDGEFVTIETVYNVGLPSGGGLNLAEVEFNFTDGSRQYAMSISSYLVLGNNAIEKNVINAIDGDTGTWTTMGNTVGQSKRLRVTVSPVPVPQSFILLLSAIGPIGLIRKRY